jgi:hypothetical protein
VKNCHGRKESISLYISGELPEHFRAELEGHMRECPFCSAELSAAGSLEELLREQPLEPAPANLSSRVMHAVDEFEISSRSLELTVAEAMKRIRRFGFWQELLSLGVICTAVVLLVNVFLPQLEVGPLTSSAATDRGTLDIFLTFIGVRNGGANATYLNPPVIFLSILFGAVNVFGLPRALSPDRLVALVRFW